MILIIYLKLMRVWKQYSCSCERMNWLTSKLQTDDLIKLQKKKMDVNILKNAYNMDILRTTIQYYDSNKYIS